MRKFERPSAEGGFALAFIAIWAFTLLVNLAIAGAIIWAVLHFVLKYW